MGGPYTIKDKEERRKEVHKLHFEKGFSAVRIAEILKVNRNTINEDIKYWYSNIKEEVKHENEDYILRQIGRLESQRSSNKQNYQIQKFVMPNYSRWPDTNHAITIL
ncbi:MAG: hypothetical protein OEX98_05400 [Nitrosopumilus sp.]|nr:hypothetical protein [Nitrosopumilus sp.]